MQYKRKTVERWKYDGLRVFLFFGFLALIPGGFEKIYWDEYPEFISPVSANPIVKVVEEIPQENLDTWVDKYTRKYFDGYKVSEVKMIMHCLLHRESGHGASHNCGDSGLACGPLQFHQETWNRMRGQMLKAGLIEDIGNRLDMEQAIHTTVWAIYSGRATEWGPIYRNYIGGDYATCQTPSWY